MKRSHEDMRVGWYEAAVNSRLEEINDRADQYIQNTRNAHTPFSVLFNAIERKRKEEKGLSPEAELVGSERAALTRFCNLIQNCLTVSVVGDFCSGDLYLEPDLVKFVVLGRSEANARTLLIYLENMGMRNVNQTNKKLLVESLFDLF